MYTCFIDQLRTKLIKNAYLCQSSSKHQATGLRGQPVRWPSLNLKMAKFMLFCKPWNLYFKTFGPLRQPSPTHITPRSCGCCGASVRVGSFTCEGSTFEEAKESTGHGACCRTWRENAEVFKDLSIYRFAYMSCLYKELCNVLLPEGSTGASPFHSNIFFGCV